MDPKGHFMAGKKFKGKDSGREITWKEENGRLFLEFEYTGQKRRICAPEIGNNTSLADIYDIFADWRVCDYMEDQELKKIAYNLKQG